MPIRRAWFWSLPLLVLAASLAITAGLWRHERQTAERALRGEFDTVVRQTAVRIEQRMTAYEQMLRGMQGLMRAVGRDDLGAVEAYVDAQFAGAHAAGVSWFAYAAWMPSADGGGRAPIAAAAPASVRTEGVLGDDPLADPQRRQALELARDAGSLAITPALRRLAAADPEDTPGFLMVLPVYAPGPPLDTVAARRAALSGWVIAAVRMGDLMASLYGEAPAGVAAHIYDGIDLTPAALMTAPGPEAAGAQAPVFETLEYFAFAGHAWTM